MIKSEKYDIIIAGSGLGGLLCGVILSKAGYQVLVLEKNLQIGGCLQTFKRKGVTFDTGMHYVGSMSKGQVLDRVFNYLDLTDKIPLRRMDLDCFDKIIFKEKEYNYAQGYDRFTAQILEYFPKEKKAINNYVEGIRHVIRSFDLYSLRPVQASSIIKETYAGTPATTFIDNITQDELLRSVLAGLNGLYAGVPDVTPIYIHAAINNFFIQSAWRLVDGGSQLAVLLTKTIIENGGEVINKSEVMSFEVVDNKMHHVKLKDGSVIRANYFISNIHPARTLSMINGGNLRKAYINRITSLKNTIGMFTVYAVLKKDVYPYINYNIHYYKCDDIWGTRSYSLSKWPEGFMMYTPAATNVSSHAESLMIMTYMKYEELARWENTYVERRGEDYKEMKHEKAEKLLDLVESVYPGTRNAIDVYYTSTPLTYRDYTGTQDGSSYGVIKDAARFMESFIHPKTKIPNLLFTGQNINMHGILGVSLGAFLTCSMIPGCNNLLKNISSEV